MTDNWEESLEPIYSNDTELTKDICDFLKCSEYKHGNESEPTACYGCDAMYDIFYQEEKRIIEDDDKYNYIQSLLDKKAEEVSNEFISACNCNFCNGSGLDEAVTVYFDFDGEKCMDRKLIECSFCKGTGSRINHEHYDQLKRKYIKGESNGKDS
jgi:hypothetical protein